MTDRRDYNREQKAAARERARRVHDARTIADTLLAAHADRIADTIADRIVSAVTDRLSAFPAFADTEGVRGVSVSATGTHPAPKGLGVGVVPDGSADADRGRGQDTNSNGSADADRQRTAHDLRASAPSGARAPYWDADDPRLDLTREEKGS